MKKHLIFATLTTVLLMGCYPTTKVTGSWKNPKNSNKTYSNVLIAALTANSVARSTIETELEIALNKVSVKTAKSLDQFPPNFAKDSVTRRDVMKMVKKKGSEVILTITILKKETESRYVSGGYTPTVRYGYYDSFWGYYNYRSPYTYSEDYYTGEDIYYLETNLYDSSTETLLWSAQSKTYYYNGFANFSKQYAKVIVDQMRKDGMIK